MSEPMYACPQCTLLVTVTNGIIAYHRNVNNQICSASGGIYPLYRVWVLSQDWVIATGGDGVTKTHAEEIRAKANSLGIASKVEPT